MTTLRAYTDERRDFVLELAKQGHSASAIAKKFYERWEVKKTRNAIIGLCYRNGAPLTGNASRAERNQASQRREMRAARTKPPKRDLTQSRALAKVFAAAEPLPPPQESDIGRVHILDLGSLHCRWPVAEPKDGMFCGKNKITGLPYCEHHARRAFRPPNMPPPRTYYTPTIPALEKLEELQPA